MTKKLALSLLSGLSLVCLTANPALAQDNDKVEALEKKLNKAMSLIEQQSTEMQQLREKLDDVKSAKSSRSGPVTSGNVASRLERVEETLDYVEESVFQIDDRTNGRTVANTFDAEKLNIGGFFKSAFTHVDADGGSASAFYRQNFDVLCRWFPERKQYSFYRLRAPQGTGFWHRQQKSGNYRVV